ncbi:MAG: hypothetical protein J0L55_02630 [Caulobacterales bacterium]|nr:hypothetical protein [Caulobacterales bacterium]MCA0372742.1 hypothetical protein [Pseudomonadota bacterium]
MNQSNQDLKSEIEYIKNMVQKGDIGPLNIGRALLWAGAAILFYTLARLSLDIKFLMPKDFQFSSLYFKATNYIALLTIIIFASGLFLDRRNIFGIGEKSTASKVANTVWLGVLIGTVDFLLCFIAFGVSFLNHGQIEDYLNHFPNPPIILGIFSIYFTGSFLLISIGIGWLVTSVVSGKKWLNFFSIGSFLLAPITIYIGATFGGNYSFLLSFLLFCILPAYLSLRDEKAK